MKTSERVRALSLPEGQALLSFELAAHNRLMRAPAGATRRRAFVEAYAEWPQLMEEFSAAMSGARQETLGFSQVFVDWFRPWLVDRRVLEIGCGAGRGALALSKVAREVVGVDVAEALLVKARALGIANGHFIFGDPTDRLPFDDGSFDSVYWNDVAEHLHPEDLALALAEICRVLRPGGHLCTLTCHQDDGPHDTSNLILPRGSAPLGMHLQEFTYRSWARALAANGLSARLPMVGVSAVSKARGHRLLPALMAPWGPVELLENTALSRHLTLTRWLLGSNMVFSVATRVG